MRFEKILHHHVRDWSHSVQLVYSLEHDIIAKYVTPKDAPKLCYFSEQKTAKNPLSHDHRQAQRGFKYTFRIHPHFWAKTFLQLRAMHTRQWLKRLPESMKGHICQQTRRNRIEIGLNELCRWKQLEQDNLNS